MNDLRLRENLIVQVEWRHIFADFLRLQVRRLLFHRTPLALLRTFACRLGWQRVCDDRLFRILRYFHFDFFHRLGHSLFLQYFLEFLLIGLL